VEAWLTLGAGAGWWRARLFGRAAGDWSARPLSYRPTRSWASRPGA